MTVQDQAREIAAVIKKEQVKLEKFSEEAIQKQRDRIQNKITAYKVQLADLNLAQLG